MVFDFLKGEFIDVITWLDDTRDTMVWWFGRRGQAIKTRTRLALAAAVGLGTPAVANENPSVAWILAESETPLLVAGVGEMKVRGTELVGVDGLAFNPSDEWSWFTVPSGPADIVAFFSRRDIAYHMVAIIFSNTTPVCGEKVSMMTIDSGTGAFLDRRTAESLENFGAAMGAKCDLYACFVRRQVPSHIFAQILRLPDGTTYPAFSAGYGEDGSYPVFLLRDADGAPTAAYVDFTGMAGEYEWLAPPACPKP
jgi:hypothetical protein